MFHIFTDTFNKNNSMIEVGGNLSFLFMIPSMGHLSELYKTLCNIINADSLNQVFTVFLLKKHSNKLFLYIYVT